MVIPWQLESGVLTTISDYVQSDTKSPPAFRPDKMIAWVKKPTLITVIRRAAINLNTQDMILRFNYYGGNSNGFSIR